MAYEGCWPDVFSSTKNPSICSTVHLSPILRKTGAAAIGAAFGKLHDDHAIAVFVPLPRSICTSRMPFHRMDSILPYNGLAWSRVHVSSNWVRAHALSKTVAELPPRRRCSRRCQVLPELVNQRNDLICSLRTCWACMTRRPPTTATHATRQHQPSRAMPGPSACRRCV